MSQIATSDDWTNRFREELPPGLESLLQVSNGLLVAYQDFHRARLDEMELEMRLSQARMKSDGARKALDEAIKTFMYDTHTPRKF